ncbi:MAG: biotin/lipoyl-binding protein [Acetatifactor sp.]|nr:biotin/lipoyl-binding protein [Acetatifactor sp.]
MNENENRTKRKEWVKNAAIIFLTVLLILTFFSNTIMNYSLPEVATQYVQSGTITAKIRENGVVESGDPYEVTVTETRKVKSVAVKVGDTVEEGDILLYLDDVESDELVAAREALETAQDAYEKSLLAAEVTAEILNEANKNTSVQAYRQQMTAAQAEVDSAQKEVDKWQEKYDKLQTQIESVPSNTANISEETKAYNNAKTAKENAEFSLTAAKNNLATINAKIEYAESISDGDAITSLTPQKQEAEKNLISAQATADNAALAFAQAETALNNKKATGDTSGTVESLTNQQKSVNTNLQAAKTKLEEKQAALTKLLTTINQVFGIQDSYDAVAKAKENLNKQLEKSIGATITAEVAGKVMAVNVTAGKNTAPDTPVVTLQPEGKGFFMNISVSNEKAKRLSIGDRAELVNSWRYDDIDIVLSSIKTDPKNPGQNKLLTFDVTGDVNVGQTLNISVGQKSANYDLIVPNSAIREDNNGKFILTVETKSTPLSNRYIATRTDVEVIASDDTQSAIKAALYGYEFVITTSTKPVEAGKQVRLANN